MSHHLHDLFQRKSQIQSTFLVVVKDDDAMRSLPPPRCWTFTGPADALGNNGKFRSSHNFPTFAYLAVSCLGDKLERHDCSRFYNLADCTSPVKGHTLLRCSTSTMIRIMDILTLIWIRSAKRARKELMILNPRGCYRSGDLHMSNHFAYLRLATRGTHGPDHPFAIRIQESPSFCFANEREFGQRIVTRFHQKLLLVAKQWAKP